MAVPRGDIAARTVAAGDPGHQKHAVIFSPQPDSALGGQERFCMIIREVLEDAGWRATIVGPPTDPPRWVYRVGAGWVWSAGEATRAMRRLQADLVISNGYLGARPPRGVPRIHVLHGNAVGHTLRGGSSLRRRERWRRVVGAGLAEALSVRRGATVVAVSESAAEEARRYYRAHVDRVIENAVDVNLFAPHDPMAARERLGLEADGRYALYVGRWEPIYKGAELLVPACRQSGFELLVAAPQRPPGGRYLGALTREQMVDAYTAADCVLFPTRYEGCSYVVLEALASCTPLVTTRVGWMKTFLAKVPEYEALAVEPSVDDIAARMQRLAELDLPRLTALARAWVEEHNGIPTFARNWVAMAQETVAGVRA
jgi:glycosyltransferase involved in cell wall biosynthesis